MGVQLGELVPKETISLESLAGRTIAIDAFNTIYQFISIIRQPDGTPLMDSKGRVTSHLSGLLYRTARLVEAGVLPAYVFDGRPPSEKAKVVAERRKARGEAHEKWREAREKGEVKEAMQFAKKATQINDEMIDDAKELLSQMGIPVVQAPEEGEAQAAAMAAAGDAWAAASQDFDALLFGTPVLVRNINITGKKKLPRKEVYVNVEPEKIELEKTLETLGISREQLVEIGLLCGTDYNDGVPRVGPKTALKLIAQEGKTAEQVFSEHGVVEDVGGLKKMFLKPNVTKKYELEWARPDREQLVRFLVEEHDFSLERITKAVGMLEKLKEEKAQSRLDGWFK